MNNYTLIIGQLNKIVEVIDEKTDKHIYPIHSLISTDQDDMDAIAKMDTGKSLILNPFLPSEVKRVYNYDATRGK